MRGGRYTATRVFELWSPGDNLTATGLMEQTTLTGFSHPLGLCIDGMVPHVALGCPSSHNGCDQSASINVTAFDGNKKFPDTVQALVRERWPRTAGKFYYNHMALLDKPGYVSFSQPETEGGFISSGNDQSDMSVRGSTVDLYMRENGLVTLDVLKVDAEGFDDSVLRGAHDALTTSVRFVQYEANPLKIETVHMLDSLGFTCFLAGSRGWGSFAKLTGCVSSSFFATSFASTRAYS